MQISIIIPTYKPQDYIIECLVSIKNQTLKPNLFEIIIILNGEQHPYQEKITNTINRKLKNNNITLIYNKVSGVSAARNKGISKAVGKYLTFIDDDDYISPTYLEELLDIAYLGYFPLSNLLVYNDNNGEINKNYLGRSFVKNKNRQKPSLFQVRSFFSTPCCKLIEKDTIGNRRFNEAYSNGEDALFMATLTDKISKIKFTTSEAIYYRRNRSNSLTTRKRNRLKKIILDFKLIKEYFSFWLRNFKDYNFLFMSSRIAAKFKSMFL